MTPREPDRFDKQARVLMDSECVHDREDDEIPCVLCLADFLREAESSALERAADYVEHRTLDGWFTRHRVANEIRALIPPAAAPAANRRASFRDCTCYVVNGGITPDSRAQCPRHAPAAETGKAQGAEAPDLREALEDLFGAVQNPDLYIEGVSTVTRPLRMAIAKARIALAARAAPPKGEGK